MNKKVIPPYSSLIPLPSSLNFPVLESPLAGAVGGDGVAVADQLVLVGRQAFEADGAARVELGGADAELRAQSVAEAVGEARRGAVVDARRVHRLHEARRRFVVLRHD